MFTDRHTRYSHITLHTMNAPCWAAATMNSKMMKLMVSGAQLSAKPDTFQSRTAAIKVLRLPILRKREKPEGMIEGVAIFSYKSNQ